MRTRRLRDLLVYLRLMGEQVTLPEVLMQHLIPYSPRNENDHLLLRPDLLKIIACYWFPIEVLSCHASRLPFENPGIFRHRDVNRDVSCIIYNREVARALVSQGALQRYGITDDYFDHSFVQITFNPLVPRLLADSTPAIPARRYDRGFVNFLLHSDRNNRIGLGRIMANAPYHRFYGVNNPSLDLILLLEQVYRESAGRNSRERRNIVIALVCSLIAQLDVDRLSQTNILEIHRDLGFRSILQLSYFAASAAIDFSSIRYLQRRGLERLLILKNPFYVMFYAVSGVFATGVLMATLSEKGSRTALPFGLTENSYPPYVIASTYYTAAAQLFSYVKPILANMPMIFASVSALSESRNWLGNNRMSHFLFAALGLIILADNKFLLSRELIHGNAVIMMRAAMRFAASLPARLLAVQITTNTLVEGARAVIQEPRRVLRLSSAANLIWRILSSIYFGWVASREENPMRAIVAMLSMYMFTSLIEGFRPPPPERVAANRYGFMPPPPRVVDEEAREEKKHDGQQARLSDRPRKS